MRKISNSLLMLLLMAVMLSCGNGSKRGFAIVVDSLTYKNIQQDIDAYARAVEDKEGLKTYIVLDKWGVPDSIRAALKKLYKKRDEPIEGAVLIGDIPVAMVRDGQHLTTAFKMDQRRWDRKESSVPSDRFYDDFGLSFTYIDKDADNPLWFYYSLDASGSQVLKPEIYSARIKANDDWGTTRYQKIADYLKKAVEQKNEENKVDQLLFFGGHGYASESLDARMDEKIAYLDNFPWLKGQQNSIEYMDHSRDVAIKHRLKNEMQREDLDIASLHHHGDPEIEYMDGVPLTDNRMEQYEQLRQYCRENLRIAKERGKDIAHVKDNLLEMFPGITEKFFEGAFDKEQMLKDSIYNESFNQYYYEYETYHPNCRLVIMDACYNGSFHQEKYIGGAYIFNSGKTMVAIGNSVNVLQDKWSDRYVGALALGMRVGRMVQYNAYLEQHLMGDPTFHFTPVEGTRFDVNKALSNKHASFWKKQLKSSSAALRSLALRRLVDLGYKNVSDLLLERFKESTSLVERFEAMMLLSECKNEDFVKCLQLALNDSYEMVQRFAVNFVAKVGDLSLVPPFINVVSRNNTTERIEFDAEQALSVFPADTLMRAFEQHFKEQGYYFDQKKTHDEIGHAIEVCAGKWLSQVRSIYSDTIPVRAKRMYVRFLRNNNIHAEVPRLLDCVQKCEDDTLQVDLLEALGWFNYSYLRDTIAAVTKRMSACDTYAERVRNEALKTYHRVTSYRCKED